MNQLVPAFDKNGIPLVQFYTAESLRLLSGSVLEQARIGYCVYGESEKNPVIVLHPALTGAPIAWSPNKSSQGEGWWNDCIGPGRFLDTQRFTIVCVDHIGGDGGSTRPEELGDALGQILLGDTVNLTAQFLRDRGVETLHAVIGGSTGGGQSLRWLFQDLIDVKRVFEISGCGFQSDRAREFFQIKRDLLLHRQSPEALAERLLVNCDDLTAKTAECDDVISLIETQMLEHGNDPDRVVGIARLIGFLRFVSPLYFEHIVRREFEASQSVVKSQRSLLSWCQHQAQEFTSRFSGDSLACLCDMVSREEAIEPEKVAEQIQSRGTKLIGFSVSGDLLYDSDRQLQYYRSIRSNLDSKDSKLVAIEFAFDQLRGHDHFLSKGFLESVPKLRKHLLDDKEQSSFSTRVIHSETDFHDGTGSVVPPLYMTSTFRRGNELGYDYTRSGNPNFRHLEAILANLEGASYATVFGSGVAAITAVMSTLKAGDTVMLEEVVYGCTYRLLEQVLKKFGVRAEYFDMSTPENWSRIIEERPALVWIESPTNPTLKLIDLRSLGETVSRAGSTLVVDNTFASSFCQQPLELGAHISLSSTTKYINGHSDCLGGAVCTNSAVWAERMVFAQKALGLNPSPFDTWLITRGLKTLSVRMERHNANGLAFAKRMEELPGVRYVRYPMLESHPQYELAKQQMSGGSGMVAVDFDLPPDKVFELISSLKMFTLAESLGGVESLVCQPASMSHGAVPVETRERLGITESLVRFSVGAEDARDLIEDVEIALRDVSAR